MKAKNKEQEKKWFRQLILDTLNEVCTSDRNIAKDCLPHNRDVNNIKLQRMKHTEKQVMDFKLRKPRSKWELVKALQEEFDKFPDDTVFTSFSAVGIGIGRSGYL